MRWELYPDRTRSAGLGIESYDPTTNEVLVGGRGGIPQDNGVGYSKKLFAPRVGFAYQVTDSTVIRSGYGITYHSHPWGAQALRGWYPLTIVAVFHGVNGYQPVTTDPELRGGGRPEQASGPDCRHSTDLLPGYQQGQDSAAVRGEMGYPVANQELHRGYIQSWNFIIERKLPGEFVTSVGYVGTASVNGFAFLDINASQIPGSGDDGRPLFAKFGRTADHPGVGRPHAQQLPLAAGHHQPALLGRPVPEGCLHLLACHRHGQLWRLDGVQLERGDRVRSQPRLGGEQHPAHVPARLRVRAAVRQTARSGPPSGVAKAMLGGWQFNGVFAAYQGRPVHAHAPPAPH